MKHWTANLNVEGDRAPMEWGPPNSALVKSRASHESTREQIGHTIGKFRFRACLDQALSRC